MGTTADMIPGWGLSILIKCMQYDNSVCDKAKLFYFDIWATYYMSYNSEYNHPVAARDWTQYIWNVELTMLSNIKLKSMRL